MDMIINDESGITYDEDGKKIDTGRMYAQIVCPRGYWIEQNGVNMGVECNACLEKGDNVHNIVTMHKCVHEVVEKMNLPRG